MGLTSSPSRARHELRSMLWFVCSRVEPDQHVHRRQALVTSGRADADAPPFARAPRAAMEGSDPPGMRGIIGQGQCRIAGVTGRRAVNSSLLDKSCPAPGAAKPC